jgi:hypothetical protein
MSVSQSTWNNLTPTEPILMNFDIRALLFFVVVVGKSCEKVQVLLKYDKNNGRFTLKFFTL